MTTAEALYHQLRAGEIPEARWSEHAKQRARELVLQCVPVGHIDKALTAPQEVFWSPKYECPNSRYGDVTLGWAVDDDGHPVVVTVLPSSKAAWDRVHATGLVSDRECREDPFR